jgi:hypothetical protein
MAGGPIFPTSIYVGGASGQLSPNFYIPATNTNTAGAIEGVALVASSSIDAPCVLQFNLPEVIPSGTCKIRALAFSSATSGTAVCNIADGQTAPNNNIGATSLTSETPISQAWATADIILENKVTLTTTPTSNDIMTVLATFKSSGTLAAQSIWQFSLIWE